MWNIASVPKDVRKTSSLDYINGYALPETIGDVNEEQTQAAMSDLAYSTARMTYGNRLGRQEQKTSVDAFVPAHVSFDKKVLLFTAYMKSTVHESSQENFRVRYLKIYYYLEDDTIAIVEPEVMNSGIQQGVFLKRQRIPRDATGITYHWKELNIGCNMSVYGKVIRITDCNEWTRRFLTKEGISVNPVESAPEDPYIVSRLPVDKPSNSYQTPSDFDKLKQFLTLDRKVLRFFATWDDRQNMFGEMRNYILHYYLENDTIEIREKHEGNDGRDPFPILLARQKIPRNHRDLPFTFPTCALELTENEYTDLLNPADFGVGRVTHIYGRDFLVTEVDEFTAQFYKQNFGLQDADFTPINTNPAAGSRPTQARPPHNGIGTAEDAYLSCVYIAPKAPLGQKSLPKLLKYANQLLRYEAHLETTAVEDKDRTFIISYRLADDYISIFEPPKDNSGTTQGKFLEARRVQREGSNPDLPEYIGFADFFVGATVSINGRKFVVDDADVAVFEFMQANPGLWPADVAAKMQEIGLKKNIL